MVRGEGVGADAEEEEGAVGEDEAEAGDQKEEGEGCEKEAECEAIDESVVWGVDECEELDN